MLDILPIKFKFFLNDLALFYKIINSLVSIKLPGHFIVLQGDRVRCTRTTSAIISQNDTTLMKCNIRPNCESFAFIIELWLCGTDFPITLDKRPGYHFLNQS